MKYTFNYGIKSTLEDAVKALDAGGVGFLALIDDLGKLIGILTDGDLRRAILNKETDLNKVMNIDPSVMSDQSTKQEVIQRLKALHRRHMPLVDENNKLKSVFTLDDIEFSSKKNRVVIMAGGLGSRLGELTKETPKPMLKVGDRPMLQHLIEQFRDQGFRRFTFCVNYRKEVISDYFGSGENFGVKIDYIVEKKKLGTAGALTLIKEKFKHPFFVINADILTTLDFQKLISFHEMQNSCATMCVRSHSQQVPYGVIKADQDSKLTKIEEKPSYSFNVNAGIYVLEPSILKHLPCDEFFDMPTLFDKLLVNEKHCSVFNLRDYWLDIGQINDFKKANDDMAFKAS